MRSTLKLRGFTLIELLVVIAIIAILAAILFPVFARARENARRTNCQSNLKQIALGIMQYTQDFDERLPLYDGGVPNTSPMFGWTSGIQPYLKSVQLFQCPSEPTAQSSGPTVEGFSDYGYNLRLGYWTGWGTVSLATLTQPTLTVVNFDHLTARGLNYSAGAGTAVCTTTTGCPDNTRAVLAGGANRHLEGANFSFADGHVKWYRSANNSSTAMANVWNVRTDLATSGGDPTFNISP